VAIEAQRLKISRFADLNDPFELLALNRHSQACRWRIHEHGFGHHRAGAAGTGESGNGIRIESVLAPPVCTL
jgi:hypothetical protein